MAPIWNDPDYDMKRALRLAGWGPFPLPGENKRLHRAMNEARHILELADEIRNRGTA